MKILRSVTGSLVAILCVIALLAIPVNLDDRYPEDHEFLL